MNPVLVQAVRERMRERSTDDLRDLWQTNDRVTWSPETFEAVKSLLAERGVTELPPQNDPAPMARPHLPSDVPDNVYWLGWLRPALWLGIVIGTLTLLRQAVSLYGIWDQIDVNYLTDSPWETFIGFLHTLVLPALLIGGGIGCLRFVPVARLALLVYAWTQLAVLTLSTIQQVWQLIGDYTWPDYALSFVENLAQQAVLPVVLLILLRRQEIRAVFTTARPGGGFDPKLPAETPERQPSH